MFVCAHFITAYFLVQNGGREGRIRGLAGFSSLLIDSCKRVVVF